MNYVYIVSMDDEVGDEVGEDSDPDEKSSPRKKRQYRQRFKKEYIGIVQSKNGSGYAYCEKCVGDFSVSHGGLPDIVRQLKTKKNM